MLISFYNFDHINNFTHNLYNKYYLNLKSKLLHLCPKLFTIKEFYFLILKSNVEPHHKYSSKWVIKFKNQMFQKKSTKTKESRTNKS